NEVDFENFTIFGRLIYDNKDNPDGSPGTTDVLGGLRNIASDVKYNGRFDPNVITFSVDSDRPANSGGDCTSVYGDSALLMKASELLAAFAGGASVIGTPFPPYTTNGTLTCGGSAGPPGTGGAMISMPVSYTKPTITDNHVKPCVVTSGPPYSCTTQD